MAVVPFTFKDGLCIPAGTQVAFCSQQQNIDPDFYTDPEKFDPRRWLKQREEKDLNRFHFPSTTDDWLNWGSGTHACPGRFLADVSMKLIFTHLLTHYEIKYPNQGQHRPADGRKNFMILPDMTAPVLFKERTM